MLDKNHVNRLSSVLRNDIRKSKIEMDDYGWVDVTDLCKNHKFNRELLREISNNYPKRFSFNENETKYRLNFGHNFKCKASLEQIIPTKDVLYYMTGYKMLNKILEQGITNPSSFITLTERIDNRKVRIKENLIYF